VRRRSSGAAAVIGIHPWEPLVPLRPADEHRRNAEAREGLWKRVVAVERHENDAVDVPLPYVTLDLRVLRSSRAMRRRSWSSVCARAVETPRTMLGKNGSENTRVSDSETTRAIVSVRRVTSVRAARLGVYRSCSIASRTASRVAGHTLGDPFTTRDTVAVETVASRATSAIVWLQLPLRHRPRRLRHTRAPGSGQREIRLAGGEGGLP